jgi:hypothetical protein
MRFNVTGYRRLDDRLVNPEQLDHRIVLGVGVLSDVQVSLDGPAGVRGAAGALWGSSCRAPG